VGAAGLPYRLALAYFRTMHLFQERLFADASRDVIDNMRTEVEGEDSEKLLGTDEAEYVAYLVGRWSIEPLVLDIEHPRVSDYQKMIPANQWPRGFDGRSGKSYPVQVIVYHVPYSGNEILFQCAASGGRIFGMNNGTVEGGFLELEIINWRNDLEEIKREANKILTNISINWNQLRNEVIVFNQELERQAKQIVQAKRAWYQRQKDQLASLGAPVLRPSDTSTVSTVPIILKKVVVKSTASSSFPATEWVIEDSIYEQILQMVHGGGVSMERHPKVYADKDEEGLRDHFVTLLSPHFHSVTGETFNRTGKTDIMIRHDGKNVFVAECKFWKGIRAFYATIDQILGYLTWRDSKAAVVCFVPNKEVKPVLQQIESETAKHPCFVKYHSKKADGWYNFEFHLKDDTTRSVKLAILCFHFPSGQNRPETAGNPV
jgi:hypothetical protein